jgi:hypothetical protein
MTLARGTSHDRPHGAAPRRQHACEHAAPQRLQPPAQRGTGGGARGIPQGWATHPIAHLTEARTSSRSASSWTRSAKEVSTPRGAADAAYIRRVIAVQRKASSSAAAPSCSSRQGLSAGVVARHRRAVVAKILDNMEIGHNVMHGQWDWMRDPKIHSTDVGVGQRLPGSAVEAHPQRDAPHLHQRHRPRQRPRLRHHARRRGPAVEPVRTSSSRSGTSSTRSSSSTASRPMTSSSAGTSSASMTPEAKADFRASAMKAVCARSARQMTKDYVVHPCCPSTGSVHTLTANVVANLMRNLWSNTVIICGHFPRGSRPSRTTRSRARPGASGMCARCSARPTSPAPRRCTS